MIVNVAYTIIFNTGLFPDACRAWKSRATVRKTWAQFKIDFITAHHEFRLTTQTAHQSGFHSANIMIEQGRDESMQDTAEAITHLATAMAHKHGRLASSQDLCTTPSFRWVNYATTTAASPSIKIRSRFQKTRNV
jgi:hypothetical protein